MLTPVSILPYTGRPLYTDSPAPHNVSAISPLDPQLFTTIGQHARQSNQRHSQTPVTTPARSSSGSKPWSPPQRKGLAAARTAAGSKARTAEFRRAEEDILILNGLGTYYANLFRAAQFYSIL